MGPYPSVPSRTRKHPHPHTCAHAADHGYQLGEHAEYAKHTNFELATHVPMMVSAPWLGTAGQHASSFVELVDLYRTVVSLAGLPAPAADVDGDDVSHLVAAPGAMGKNASFSQYSRCPGSDPAVCAGLPAWCHNNCEGVTADKIGVMGYTVRTAGWRYTEWLSWDGSTCTAKWAAPPVARELYSHQGETPQPLCFDCGENANVVGDAAHAGVVAQLHAMLKARYDLPSNPRRCPPSTPRASATQDAAVLGVHERDV